MLKVTFIFIYICYFETEIFYKTFLISRERHRNYENSGFDMSASVSSFLFCFLKQLIARHIPIQTWPL